MPSDELPHTLSALSYAHPSSEQRSVDWRCHGVGGGDGGGEGGGDGGGGDGGGGDGGGGDGGGGLGGGLGGGGVGGGDGGRPLTSSAQQRTARSVVASSHSHSRLARAE